MWLLFLLQRSELSPSVAFGGNSSGSVEPTCGIKWILSRVVEPRGHLPDCFLIGWEASPLLPRERHGGLHVSRVRLPLENRGFFLPWSRTPGFGAVQLQVQEMRRGLDEALSGQVARPPEPKRVIPRIVLAPEFWSPSPSQSDFIRKLRETETTNLPSADTPYPEADPGALSYCSKNPPLSPERTIAYVALAIRLPGRTSNSDANRLGRRLRRRAHASRKTALPRGGRRSPRRA